MAKFGLVIFGSVRLVIEQEIFIFLIFLIMQKKKRFSDADRQKLISRSQTTPQKICIKKKNIFNPNLLEKFPVMYFRICVRPTVKYQPSELNFL